MNSEGASTLPKDSRRTTGRLPGREVRGKAVATLIAIAALSGCDGDPPPAIPDSIIISPGSANFVSIDDTLRFTATVFDQYGEEIPGEPLTWSSPDPAVAIVDAQGVVTAKGNGTVAVQCEVAIGGPSATAAVTVSQVVATVAVSPAAATLAPGDTTRLEALVADANGHAIEEAVLEWTVRNASVAQVDALGLVTGIEAGTTVVAAMSEGIEGTAEIAVVHSGRAVLETLFRATGGASWSNNDGWLTNAPLRSWYGVEVDAMGSVRALYLSSNGLTGEIPPAIGDLPSMEVLFLHGNQLTGEIPPELGRLTNLKRLYLGSNQLTGRIPPQLGDLSRLEDLYLSGNRFSGSIPPEIGNLVDLRSLILSHVSLPGPIPSEFGNLTNLEWLYLEQSGVTGRIPPELGNLANLEFLHLGSNGLTGPIPPELGRLSDLAVMNLQANGLSGSIPPELGILANLTSLGLGFNGLTGPIPPELGNLISLDDLYLAWNGLTGPIPAELGQLSDLKRLQLHRNQLTGPLPPELGQLSHLEILNLAENPLRSPIPPEWGNLTNLESLDLRFTQLTGPIPVELGNMTDVKQLLLMFGNDLTGPIPPELGRLSNLEVLLLGSNSLTGPLPSELGRMGNLEYLWLQDNDLSGPVPPEFGAMSNLRELRLASNSSLAGSLPTELTGMVRLAELQAGNTGLCAPADSGFQDWLKGVYRVRLIRCVEGDQPAAYLTQAVQSRDFPVPLVEDERALLRVFPTSRERTSETIPLVRAWFYHNGDEVLEVDIPGKNTTIPTEVDEGDLAKSANVKVPGSVVREGLEMVVMIDPESTLDQDLWVAKRIPETGRMELEVKDMPLFDMTLVPFVWSETQDSSIVELIGEMVDDGEDHEMFGLMHLLPVHEMKLTAHDPVVTLTNNALDLLYQTTAIRLMESGTEYYMGMMSPLVSAALGVAWAPGRSSFSVPDAGVIAHEIGHNFFLNHAPCGGPAGVDPFYPYPSGSSGAWGYDFRNGGSLVRPSTDELMSYCGPPMWISDYSFTVSLRFRGHDDDNERLPYREPSQSLLLWGGIDENDAPFLKPAFVADMATVLAESPGAYRLEGLDSDGNELFSLSFDMTEIPDGDGGSGFAFAMPAQPWWASTLAAITLSGPGGTATLDTETSDPMVVLRDRASGQVRAIMGGLPRSVLSRGDAIAHLSPGRNVETLFSRGVPGWDAWR